MAAGSNNIVTDGLVGCWDPANLKSYPGTGDDWGDLVNSATAEGQNFDQTPEHVNDWAGAFLLDGTDEYFEIPDADLEVVGAFTFSVWLRFTTATTDGAGGYVVFAIRGGSGWSSEFALSILNNVYGWVQHSVRIGCKSGSSYMARWDSGIYSPYSNYNVWRNYCGVYNGDDPDDPDNFTFYFDGVDQGTRDNQYQWGVTTNGTRWSKDGANAGYLGGYLGAIHLHDRALTAAEVKQNYEALKPRFAPRITKSGMLANWDAGDPQSYNGGQTWTDTANGFVGPFYNGAGEAISFDSANGGSLVFDGTDDRIGPIILPSDYSGTARSILLWVSPDTHEQEMIAFNSADDKFKATVGQSTSYGKYIFRADVGESSPQTGSFADSLITVGDWACIGMTINASDEIVSMYLNGVSKTGGSQGWNFQDDTYIGRSSSGAPWNGKIATVRLYTKTLSAAEVLDNYNTTKGRFGH